MAKADKCPFCGSKETMLETPYIKGGKQEYTFCCQAQRKNYEYQKAHFNPRTGNQPSDEEVSKW